MIQMFLCNCLGCQRILPILISTSREEEEYFFFFFSLCHSHILDKVAFLSSTRYFPKYFSDLPFNSNDGRTNLWIVCLLFPLEIYKG